ncbi:MAG: PorV/PorQ family protein [Flavobacteriales bacterium]|jgi:hypothetical protein|nr:PorV/PorQ family protein [Flavobacteriales bacterium]
MNLSKYIYKGFILGSALISSFSTFAGNEDRAGSAGASELLINPWARSSAWADAGVSSVKGLEAMFVNVAGLSYADKTEIMFSNTNWLSRLADIQVNNFGLAQRVGETSVIGISFMSMNFGEIPITTTELPEGGIGTFNPRYNNINLAYSRQFSSSISGGINVKMVTEAIANAKASGVAFDAGVRYITGENENIKFAISLKNVGGPMAFSGDGLNLDILNTSTGTTIAMVQRVSDFELPSLLSIGASYDFLFNENNTLTLAGAFTSNSFTKDQFRLGANYTMTTSKAIMMLRAGYVFENGIFKPETRTTALTGLTAGLSVDFPFGESQSPIGLDYTYRASVFGPIHTVGARINIK